jgi:hypothetical protein
MVNAYSDQTLQFNSKGSISLDTSQFDYVLVQIIGASTALSFNTTLDSGAVTGSSDGNATSATNWVSCIGTNTATNATSTASAGNGIWKFAVVGRFLQITGGSGATVTKILVMYTKIQ